MMGRSRECLLYGRRMNGAAALQQLSAEEVISYLEEKHNYCAKNPSDQCGINDPMEG